MSVGVGPWEHRLLDWAYEGIESPPSEAFPDVTDEALLHAYAACAEVTRQHSRTFYLASGLLPPAKCRAVRVLYAFCRTSDDIVDRVDGRTDQCREAALRAWRAYAIGDCIDTSSSLILAWANVRAAYAIPRLYIEQLIDGIARDLEPTRYATFEDLAAYCYGVASTVGLMAMHVVGFSGPEALPYAVKLGVALQLTNILRDVGEDWQADRLYLPQEELAFHDLDESFLATAAVTPAVQADDRWQTFMQFQIDRVRRIYAASLPGIRYLNPDGRFAIGAAAELYAAILSDIEAHRMDVFHHRAHIGTPGKLRRLPGIWWRANVAGYT